MNLLAASPPPSVPEFLGFLFFAGIIFIWGCCMFANPKPPRHP